MKTWTKATALAVFIAALLSLTPAAHAYMETFSSGYAGFETYTIDNTGALPLGAHALFTSTGGNPGGYIYANVSNGTDLNNTRLYSFEVSGAGFGSLIGQTLTADV